MTNLGNSVVTVTILPGPTAVAVSLYRELATTSTLVDRQTHAPFSFPVSASDVDTDALITLRVIAVSATGGQTVRVRAGMGVGWGWGEGAPRVCVPLRA